MAGPEKQRTKSNQRTKALAKQDFDRDLSAKKFKSQQRYYLHKSKNRETGDFYNAIKKSAQPGMFTNTGVTLRQPISKVRLPKKSKSKKK